ncbi:metallophosphoesterase [Pseudoroseomonas globiformis]|uniref:Metallophosphoesterase n=1 Tax=Teichococcus globiformis TaxID=2307229 RepID=A0ABV7FZ32_9PROT
MTIFFTADTHFGHGGAKGLYKRPFASVAEMDAVMEANWNAVVTADDEVWHLGDFAVGYSEAAASALLGRLRGRKRLVTGNNDRSGICALNGWDSVMPYAEMKCEGRLLVLCHYAFRTWRDMGRGAVNLHGHSHGRLKPMPRQVDVGVDVWDFRPVPLPEILMGLQVGKADLGRL